MKNQKTKNQKTEIIIFGPIEPSQTFLGHLNSVFTNAKPAARNLGA